MTAPMLYHFTCDHGNAGIEASGGKLIPQGVRHPVVTWDVLWLTTLAEPDRFTTGLGAVKTKCDRMAYRWVVEPGSAARAWLFSAERMQTPAWFLKLLEGYGDPQHWWISNVPLDATREEAPMLNGGGSGNNCMSSMTSQNTLTGHFTK